MIVSFQCEMPVKHTSLFCSVFSAVAYVGLKSDLFEVKENVSLFLICVELNNPIKHTITIYLSVFDGTAEGKNVGCCTLRTITSMNM